MKICDICKDVNKSCSIVQVKTIKEEKSGKERAMITVTFDLCETCIDIFHKNLKKVILSQFTTVGEKK